MEMIIFSGADLRCLHCGKMMQLNTAHDCKSKQEFGWLDKCQQKKN